MGTTIAFACTPLAKINAAYRFARNQLWEVTTTEGNGYIAIATDAHAARHQINEMLERIGSDERAMMVRHHPMHHDGILARYLAKNQKKRVAK